MTKLKRQPSRNFPRSTLGGPLQPCGKTEKTIALFKARTLWCDGAAQLTSTGECACIRRKSRVCMGPEGNGVNPGRGNEGGPSPPDRERDKQSTHHPLMLRRCTSRSRLAQCPTEENRGMFILSLCNCCMYWPKGGGKGGGRAGV